jgi:hypothetical protein
MVEQNKNNARRGRPPKILKTVLAFLENHRGEVFCTECVTTAVVGRDAEPALRMAEGYGAPRRQGWCVKCGKLRLVSGLPFLLPS